MAAQKAALVTPRSVKFQPIKWVSFAPSITIIIIVALRTAHIVLEPLDFLARLAALVPLPRVHLMRYQGVFATHAALRVAITPVGQRQGGAQPSSSTPHAAAPGAPPPA